MLTLSANFQAHIEKTSQTRCRCLKITRRDGQVFRLTDHAQSLTFLAETYSPAGGFKISAIQSGMNRQTGSMAIEGYPVNAQFAEDIRTGLFQDADIDLYEVNRQLTSVYAQYKKGFITSIHRQDANLYYFTINFLTYRFNQKTGRIIQVECDARLGDSRCGITIGDYTESGTVTAVTSRRKFNDSSRTESDNYFRFGKLTWTSGNNSGRSSEVYANTSVDDEIVLLTAMPYDIEVDDDYNIEAGCDRQFDTCVNKFSNYLNYRGFPFIPTEERLAKLANKGVQL